MKYLTNYFDLDMLELSNNKSKLSISRASAKEIPEDLVVQHDGVVLKNTDKQSSPLSDWFQYGCAKVCVYVDSEDALLGIAKKAEERGIIAAVITDAGMTEFHGIPTKTCLALEPLPAEIADDITGELPLY